LNYIIINYIKARGFVANRYNSTFVTSDAGRDSGYGRVYVVMPIGNFNYTWSKQITDLYDDITNSQAWNNKFNLKMGDKFGADKQKAFVNRLLAATDKFGKLLSSYQGDDGSLKTAIKSKNEIMIHSNEIVLINPNFYKYYISPMLQGRMPNDKFAKSIDLGSSYESIRTIIQAA